VLRTRWRPWIGPLLATAALCFTLSVAAARTAHAAEPVIETADGPSACSAFDDKNERELADWQKQQPAVPYAYPRDDNVLNAPWGRFLKSVGTTSELILATVIPHAGAQMRGDAPAAYVGWPWSLPFGPAFTCSRRKGTFVVKRFRPNRILLEPAVVSGNRGVGFSVRPGYRFLYHPSTWVVGAGAGLGSTVEIAGNREPFRASISPEALLHFGHCCDPSYFVLAFRYDHFFGGEIRDVFGGSLGYTFF
jgi:hypothetical protein